MVVAEKPVDRASRAPGAGAGIIMPGTGDACRRCRRRGAGGRRRLLLPSLSPAVELHLRLHLLHPAGGIGIPPCGFMFCGCGNTNTGRGLRDCRPIIVVVGHRLLLLLRERLLPVCRLRERRLRVRRLAEHGGRRRGNRRRRRGNTGRHQDDSRERGDVAGRQFCSWREDDAADRSKDDIERLLLGHVGQFERQRATLNALGIDDLGLAHPLPFRENLTDGRVLRDERHVTALHGELDFGGGRRRGGEHPHETDGEPNQCLHMAAASIRTQTGKSKPGCFQEPRIPWEIRRGWGPPRVITAGIRHLPGQGPRPRPPRRPRACGDARAATRFRGRRTRRLGTFRRVEPGHRRLFRNGEWVVDERLDLRREAGPAGCPLRSSHDEQVIHVPAVALVRDAHPATGQGGAISPRQLAPSRGPAGDDRAAARAARRPASRRGACSPRFLMMVAVRLSTVAQPLDAVGERAVVRHHGAAITERGEVLRRVEAERPGGPDGADRSPGAVARCA